MEATNLTEILLMAVNGLLSLVVMLMAWIIRSMKEDIKTLFSKLAETREEYLKIHDFDKFREELRQDYKDLAQIVQSGFNDLRKMFIESRYREKDK